MWCLWIILIYYTSSCRPWPEDRLASATLTFEKAYCKLRLEGFIHEDFLISFRSSIPMDTIYCGYYKVYEFKQAYGKTEYDMTWNVTQVAEDERGMYIWICKATYIGISFRLMQPRCMVRLKPEPAERDKEGNDAYFKEQARMKEEFADVPLLTVHVVREAPCSKIEWSKEVAKDGKFILEYTPKNITPYKLRCEPNFDFRSLEIPTIDYKPVLGYHMKDLPSKFPWKCFVWWYYHYNYSMRIYPCDIPVRMLTASGSGNFKYVLYAICVLLFCLFILALVMAGKYLMMLALKRLNSRTSRASSSSMSTKRPCNSCMSTKRACNSRMSNIRASNSRMSNIRASNSRMSNIRASNSRMSNLRASNSCMSNIRASNSHTSKSRPAYLGFDYVRNVQLRGRSASDSVRDSGRESGSNSISSSPSDSRYKCSGGCEKK